MRTGRQMAATAAAALVASASLPSQTWALYESTSASPIVKTSYGHLQGTTSEYQAGVSVFKGIPYAQPPVGELRWKPPTKPAPWNGVYDATEFGDQCPQSLSLNQSIWTTGKSAMSEDCLYLNVWTANLNSTEKQPVYIWMHGGRFMDGSGDVVTFDGSGLAVRDIVVVTINDRLGPFGYFSHPELSAESPHNVSGNYGVMDMIASVEWVRDNIQFFGGDPEKITIGGQSSGSSCALDMFYSPLSQGMVAGVIAESGARSPLDPETGSLATSYREKEKALSDGVEFVAECNVSTIAEMRNLSMEVLLEFDSANDDIFADTPWYNLTSSFNEPPLFRPVLDGYVFINSYNDSLWLNGHADVPILTGNNLDESGAATDAFTDVASYLEYFDQFFSNTNLTSRFYEIWAAPNTTDEAIAQNNDFFSTISRYSSWQWAQDFYAGIEGDSSVQTYASLNNTRGANVYTYFFTHSPPMTTEITEPNPNGCYHGAEQLYVFGNLPGVYPTISWNSTELAIQDTMTAYWANFIKYGNPNGDGTTTTTGTNLTYFPPSSDSAETMWLGDSWGPQSIGTDEKTQFVQDWFEATGYVY